MTFTPRRWMFASSAWALGICMGASALASEPNAAPDAAGATGAAVAGGGKAAFWSRNNAKFALSGVTVAAPQWNAEVNTEDSRLAFTPEEQQELVQHLRAALERLVALPAVPLQVEPADGSEPAAPVPATDAAPAALGLQARITQATMPNITRNMLVMALPIPIPGVRSLLRSRGGAGIDVALVRSGEAEPLASFQCDYQAGMISILDSYRRLAQAKTAMDRCLDKLARSAPEGRLVDSAPVPVVAAAETSTRTP